jgi:cytochrome c
MTMNKLLMTVVLAAGAFALNGVAQADEALATKSGCMACHKIDMKVVGPSYKEVAEKHKGEADAVEKLSKKVKEGGSGVWGPVPMPPHPQVKDEDIKTIVTWVMSLGGAAPAAAAPAAPAADAAAPAAPK